MSSLQGMDAGVSNRDANPGLAKCRGLAVPLPRELFGRVARPLRV
jgi:hypothetical protein